MNTVDTELKQQIVELLIQQGYFSATPPYRKIMALITAYTENKVREAYGDVGNYAAETGDTKLMDFIDSRLSTPNTIKEEEH